jgi:hypothetical protein
VSAESSRLVDFWRAADNRAQLWFWLFLAVSTALVLSLTTSIRLLNKPREVIRIGCDGVPQLFTPTAQYSEPNEPEIRAFTGNFVVAMARADSFSVVNDYVDAARRMAPNLRQAFMKEARGHDGRPGTIQIIQALKRRTQIDPSSLELRIDKTNYPWRVEVKGARQIVGESVADSQPQSFSMDVELVRAPREEVLEGVLVWAVKSRGDAVGSPMGVRP